MARSENGTELCVRTFRAGSRGAGLHGGPLSQPGSALPARRGLGLGLGFIQAAHEGKGGLGKSRLNFYLLPGFADGKKFARFVGARAVPRGHVS